MADICMCFPGGLHKAFTMSYDDGVEQDKKLIAIMRKYGLKGTFNLNSGVYAPEGTVYAPGTIHRRMTEKEVSETYNVEGIEVATHGYTHPFLDRIPAPLAVKEISDDRRALEAQFNRIVRGHAYPFGTFSDEVVEILRNAGIVYARTVIATKSFEMPEDWLRLKATCHHDDPELFDIADRFIAAKDNWGYPMMFYLWGHAYEFEANDNWDRIEELAKKISNRDDIWYATNIEIYEYTQAYKSLIFNHEYSKVYNPTAQTIWFTYNGNTYEVKGGEKKDL